MYNIDKINVPVSNDFLKKWQAIVDLLAEVANVPAALIMRVSGDSIKVFRTSNTKGNPYEIDEAAPFHRECGLYCETVIRTKEKLLIPNALKDKNWDTNPDVELGMIAYLGYPISYPDSSIFGTLCILDTKENHFNKKTEELLNRFRSILEDQLALILKNIELEEAIGEIKTLSGLLPICSSCKKIRDDKGYWNQIESYISKRTDAAFSHGICEECANKLYGDQKWFKNH